MSASTAIIAEDEPIICQEIRNTLTELWPDLSIVAEVGDGIEALNAVERLHPSVLFLDIQMPGLDGLEVAQRLGGRAHVVFITAFDRYAIAAFEQGALDYVLKPISVPRMQVTIGRLRARLWETPADLRQLAQLLKDLAPPQPTYLKWLAVPRGAQLQVVAVAEISYLRADHKYTTVVTPHGSFLMNTPLGQMREKLDPQIFWQIHRSVVVNVGSIDRIFRTFRGGLEVKLKELDELLPVSSVHAHRFRELR